MPHPVQVALDKAFADARNEGIDVHQSTPPSIVVVLLLVEILRRLPKRRLIET
jgi:hypothetical protein